MNLQNSVLPAVARLGLSTRRLLGIGICSFVLLGFFMSSPAFGQDAVSTPLTRMTPELLWKLGRLGEAVSSPDGAKIAYTVRRYELAEDKGRSMLHLLNVSDGNDTTILKDWGSIGSLHWMATEDGERLFFEGTPAADPDAEDDDEGPSNQAWSMDPSNGHSVQLTSIKDGIANLKVAPGGARLAFTLDIKMDETPNEIYADLPKADARIIDSLMYRHWSAWHDYKYSHLHTAVIGPDGVAQDAVDLMKGIKADCPVPPFAGSEHFNWSPDATEIAFTMKNVEDWAESTNSDVYLVAANGSSEPRNISESGMGYDNNPAYSPDGKYLAFNSMERGGFESDRNRIFVVDRATGASKELTVGLDQNANGPAWMSDSKSLAFESERNGTNQLFRIEVENGSVAPISKGR
ncbi:MAG: Tol biopolymer transport system component, partial [Mariniblastus sp.]